MFDKLRKLFLKEFNLLSDDGQTLVEYGIILVLVSIILVSALSMWGQHFNNSVHKINDALSGINANSNVTT